MKFLLAFLPKEYRDLVSLGQRLVASLDTPAERKKAVEYALNILADGKVTDDELLHMGSLLGIRSEARHR